MSFVMPGSRRPSTEPSRVLCRLYEESGFTFPGWFPYNAKETEGKALVVVPGFRANLEASGKNTRLAYVSGWAAIDNARNRSGAEELIPYSDHADFNELPGVGRGQRGSRGGRGARVHRGFRAHSEPARHRSPSSAGCCRANRFGGLGRLMDSSPRHVKKSRAGTPAYAKCGS